MVDDIDKIILTELGKNARKSSQEIKKILQNMDYQITDRGIRHRLQKLEKNKTILGYHATLNPELISEKVNRTIILKFKFTEYSRVNHQAN